MSGNRRTPRSSFIVRVASEVELDSTALRKAIREGIQDYMQDAKLQGNVVISVEPAESLSSLIYS